MERHILLAMLFLLLLSCSSDRKSEKYLKEALVEASDNRSEMEKVLAHYKNDPEKLAAARFLIENMPEHYSYLGDDIHEYYSIVEKILKSSLSPTEQCDTLLAISDSCFPGLNSKTISDIKVISSDFLIENIDHAFNEWKTKIWAKHLSFDEFCEWLLPYKVVELQEADCWRDTLSNYFSWGLNNMIKDDDLSETTYNAANTVRSEINWRVKPFGVYNRKGYPFLSSSTLPHITFGNCLDYVTLAVLTYRSVGIPAVIDETPYWGRYRSGHSWYTVLNNRGEELTSEWDISSMLGTAFFIDKRIPKVFRNSYAINRDRKEYLEKSLYKYPFKICQKDVTDKYYNVSDIELPISRDLNIVEPYAYIATFTGFQTDWSVIDYGKVKRGKVLFQNMGRNVLYIALGYNGTKIVPISPPFILHTDGSIEKIICNPNKLRSVVIKRKYFQSKDVAKMRQRILGAKIQAANNADFSDAVDLLTINDVFLKDKTPIVCHDSFRYWRYLSPNGSYGSIAELAFFDSNSTRLGGMQISNCKDAIVVKCAFDNNWLTNFETNSADGNWVGVDMGYPKIISFVRIIPRGDDNDIHPGDIYDFRYFNEDGLWVSCGIKTATDNELRYDNIPEGAIMWVSDYTQGWDERAFLINQSNDVQWW